MSALKQRQSSSHLVIVGVGHVEQVALRGPGHAQRMLQLGLQALPVHVPESKEVLAQARQKRVRPLDGKVNRAVRQARIVSSWTS